MPIQDLREFFRESPFRVFVRSSPMAAPFAASSCRNAGGYSRSEVDGIVDQAKALGATGLVWARRLEDGAVTSSIMKAMGEEAVRNCSTGRVASGELLLIAAGEPDSTSKLLGQLRLNLAKKDGLLRSDDYAFTWVVDFPLLEWDAEERYVDRCASPVHLTS